MLQDALLFLSTSKNIKTEEEQLVHNILNYMIKFPGIYKDEISSIQQIFRLDKDVLNQLNEIGKEKRKNLEIEQINQRLYERAKYVYDAASVSQSVRNKLISIGIDLTKSEKEIIDQIVGAEKNDLDAVSKRISIIEKTTQAEQYRSKVIEKQIKDQEKEKYIRQELIELGKASNTLREGFGLTEEEINKMTLKELENKKKEISIYTKAYAWQYRSRLELDRLANTMRWVAQISIGYLAASLREAISYAIQVNKLVEGYRISSRYILMITGLAEATGMSVNQMTEAIGNYYQKLLTAGQGTSFVAARVRDALDYAGISAIKLGERAESPVVALEKMRRLFEKITDASTRAYLGQMVFGDQYEAMLPILTATNEEFSQLMLKFTRHNALSPEMTKKMILLNAELISVRQSFRMISMEIVNSMLPAFEQIQTSFANLRDVLEYFPGFKKITAHILGLTIVISSTLFVLLKITTLFDRLNKSATDSNSIASLLIKQFSKLNSVIQFLGSSLGKLIVSATILTSIAIIGEISQWRKLNAVIRETNKTILNYKEDMKILRESLKDKELTREQERELQRLENNVKFYENEYKKMKQLDTWYRRLIWAKGGTTWTKYMEGTAESLQNSIQSMKAYVESITFKLSANAMIWKDVLSKQNYFSEIASDSTLTLMERFNLLNQIYLKTIGLAKQYSQDVVEIEKSYKEALIEMFNMARKDLSSISNEYARNVKTLNKLKDVEKGTLYYDIKSLEIAHDEKKQQVEDYWKFLETGYRENFNIIAEMKKKNDEAIMLQEKRVERAELEWKRSKGQESEKARKTFNEEKKILQEKQEEKEKLLLQEQSLSVAYEQDKQRKLETIKNIELIKEYEIAEKIKELRKNLYKEEIDFALQALDEYKDFYKEASEYAIEMSNVLGIGKYFAGLRRVIDLQYTIELNQYISGLRSLGKTTEEIEKAIAEKKILLAKKYGKEYYSIFVDINNQVWKNENLSLSQRLSLLDNFINQSSILADKDLKYRAIHIKTLQTLLKEITELERNLKLRHPLESFIEEMERQIKKSGVLVDKLRLDIFKKIVDIVKSFGSELFENSEKAFENLGETLRKFASQMLLVYAQQKTMTTFYDELKKGSDVITAMAKAMETYIEVYTGLYPTVIQEVFEKFTTSFNFEEIKPQDIEKMKKKFEQYKLGGNLVKPGFDLSVIQEQTVELKNQIERELSKITDIGLSLEQLNITPDKLVVDKIEEIEIQVGRLRLIPDKVELNILENTLKESEETSIPSGTKGSISNLEKSQHPAPVSGMSTPLSKVVNIGINMNGITYPKAIEDLKNWFTLNLMKKDFLEGELV